MGLWILYVLDNVFMDLGVVRREYVWCIVYKEVLRGIGCDGR